MSAFDDGYSGEEQPEDFAEDWRECDCGASDILRLIIDTTMWEMVMEGDAEVGIDEDGEPVYYVEDDGRDDNL